MNKEKWLPLAIVFLGTMILIGSIQIANQLVTIPRGSSNVNVDTNNISYSLDRIANKLVQSQENEETEKASMYFNDAAIYLGFTPDEFKILIEEKNLNVPYIKLDNRYIFYKVSLDEWAKNINQQEIKLKNN